ncbi:uncharacterized protein LOC110103864 isoform X2 [Dendrobium catenatum]|uniref:Myb-like domain-containing protein n=2 Tax=Dendrobium TaxID=37818 RepID=A0A8T3AM32_DENNO|nr:uncharacterized protein LOC110103864 isoform X2 [Dendrobium catenatum]KAI0497084.1 hypothetical protein KFK09_023412 [Dendrobium nobile]PKU63115.1 hypothetical protein MA16_Dca024277 [Dendrobium catenatum]
MQEAQPVVQALAAAHCNEDTTSHQSPSKRKIRVHSQPKHDNSSSQTPRSSRYTRSQAAPDWTVQEVLVLLSEIVAIDEAWLKELSSYQRWKMISDSCMAMNVVRSSNQCKRKWEMLLDDYNKIMKWEPQSSEDSYWLLPEDRRKDYGLPVSFQKEVFDAMDAVIQVQQQQSDSNNSDPELIISVHKFETSKMNADSETSVLYLPSVHLEEELVTTSKILEVEASTLKSPDKTFVLAGLHSTSASVSIGDEITPSKIPEVQELTASSKISEERPVVEELNITSKNLQIRTEVEELIATSKRPDVKELLTTSKSSEEGLEVVEPNTTSKNLGERPEVQDLITTSKSLELEDLITASKSPEVDELITTSKSSKKALVIAVSGEEELITTSKSSEAEELITTSKSSDKASVITVFDQVELVPKSKSTKKARLITGKLQENAEHVCAILRSELQDGASHSPLPIDSLKPSLAETEFARRQADELIKALGELTNSLDELCDHISKRGCAGIVTVDSKA